MDLDLEGEGRCSLVVITHPPSVVTAHLLCHLVLYVSLDPAQHEGLEDHVQPRELVLVQGRLLLRVALDVAGEPLVELLVRVEHGGHDEVQQGPQLEREGEGRERKRERGEERERGEGREGERGREGK